MTRFPTKPTGQLLLGIDVGTSSTKVAAFDLDGVEVASATREYDLITPQPGFVEQNPDIWWEATCKACQEVTSQLDPDRIVGIGVAGQSWALVLVDDDGEVLVNSPLWMDTRATTVASEVESRVGAKQIFSTSGNPFSPTYTTPKLLWFMRERPDIVARASHALQSNSFIVHRLTGIASQDASMTYGLHFADIRTGEYDVELAEELGVPLDLFVDAVPCDQIVGSVTEEAAKLTGLREGTPVVAGGLDAACGALGAGVHERTQCQEQGGQAGGISVATDELIVDPRLICSRHVVPGLWLLQGGTAAGGAALRWAAAQLGEPNSSFREIDERASKSGPVPGGLIFLPYLSGERSPIWDPDARGVIFGLTLRSTRSEIMRSVLEGVAFALQDNVLVMRDAGAEFGQTFAIGGASQSRLWTQIKSDVTGLDISVPVTHSATPLGAAMLAGVGTGVYRDYSEAVARTQAIERTHTPNRADAEIYETAFHTYRTLYQSLAPLMKSTSEQAKNRLPEGGKE